LERRTGDLIKCSAGGETYHTFIPHPLPPNPPLQLDSEHLDLLEKANRSLGRLDGVVAILPDTSLFLYFYVRKEAVLSSQIEGTQSSLSDLLLFENNELTGVPLDDVLEVSNYVAAMEHGLKLLRGGLPLSLRLIKEIHGVLLSKGRGSDKTPGEFKRSQNWIGGSRPGNAVYVPTPPERVIECMGDLEKFLHGEPEATPLLIKAALSHVQFESIHPFLDGNGRLGRLLITFLMCAENALSDPLLYLSLYLKENRSEYYDWLQRVRLEGDWEGWLKFFLVGVQQTADQAVCSAKDIIQVFEADKSAIGKLGRASGNALRLHQLFQKKMLLTAKQASSTLELSPPTINATIAHLQKLGIVGEMTGKKRGKVYIYNKYFNILNRENTP